MSERPVLYLDIDDTLLRFPPSDRAYLQAHPEGGPPNGVEDFLRFAREHFEVRWLSMWAMNGPLHPELVGKLAAALRVDGALLDDWDNPRGFMGDGRMHKTDGIDWEEHRAGREWFWIEDHISAYERQVLRGNGAADRYIPCNVSEDPDALVYAHGVLAHRLGLRPSLSGEPQ